MALLSIQQLPEDKLARVAPVLSGGVGKTFNEPAPGVLPVVFDIGDEALGLLEMYCNAAFLALQAQKSEFLKYNADAMYPCDSSVFSAATFEFGGPHCRNTPTGAPDRFHAATWSVLTSLGRYVPLSGGHIIFWDLGLVVTFPPGASILIPTGVIRYSFIKFRPGEHRYSLLQWAGTGISRWFQNGHHMDNDFAMQATRVEHEVREALCRSTHNAILDLFPIEGDLPGGTRF
ncbi:hypothetical protein MSAN_00580500 [Mycena sanguinolenta]|uniref:Uncharacterized protein n=1 Tax=Mycena sanguinolenta TaxID=230812 RepID=A0A8H6Z6Z1_9AGAR|nr:hypothetical protein MSAN_00580500 [Mycena sanguinolenta]